MKVLVDNGKQKMNNNILSLEVKDLSHFTTEQKITYLKNMIKLFFLEYYEKDFKIISKLIDSIDFDKYIDILSNQDTSTINLLTVELYLIFKTENLDYINEKDIYNGICNILRCI